MVLTRQNDNRWNLGELILVWHTTHLNVFLSVFRVLSKAIEAYDGELDILPPNQFNWVGFNHLYNTDCVVHLTTVLC